MSYEHDHDPVNNPNHYQSESGVECIDAIEAALTPAEAAGFRKGQVFKYLWRAGKKDDYIEDLEKAQWYLDREIDTAKADWEDEANQPVSAPDEESPRERARKEFEAGVQRAIEAIAAREQDASVGSANEPTPDLPHRPVHSPSGRPPAGIAVVVGSDW